MRLPAIKIGMNVKWSSVERKKKTREYCHGLVLIHALIFIRLWSLTMCPFELPHTLTSFIYIYVCSVFTRIWPLNYFQMPLAVFWSTKTYKMYM